MGYSAHNWGGSESIGCDRSFLVFEVVTKNGNSVVILDGPRVPPIPGGDDITQSPLAYRLLVRNMQPRIGLSCWFKQKVYSFQYEVSHLKSRSTSISGSQPRPSHETARLGLISIVCRLAPFFSASSSGAPEADLNQKQLLVVAH